MEQSHETTETLSDLSFEQLEAERLKAFALNDISTLENICMEARRRDRINFDETIGKWHHLAQDCQEGIRILSTHYREVEYG